MVIDKYIDEMIKANASDLFLRAGSLPRIRVLGEVEDIKNQEKLTVEDVSLIVKEIVEDDNLDRLNKNRNYEGAFYYKEDWRMRISIFFQRNTLTMVVRKIDLRIATFEQLGLPVKVLDGLCKERRGLVLVTGTTGSGKSTTIASMIEKINRDCKKHILSIEEPIEFTFKDKKSLINQRAVGKDVSDYFSALRQFALHSPDVIFIGNIRDEETMRAALDAADTGVLVLSTMHTVNASQTVERIIGFFPPYQHNQVLMQLSQLLKGVVSLRLISRKDASGLIPACEVMTLSPTVSRLIRESKIWEIERYIEEGDVYGMVSFEQSLLKLVKEGIISPESAVSFSDRKEELRMRIQHDI